LRICSAKDFWGLSAFETEDEIRKQYSKNAGILLLTSWRKPSQVANIVSQKGRAGGRPEWRGYGLKNLKAIIIEGLLKFCLLTQMGCES